VADLGISGRDAVQLLIDTQNQKGGLAGREIQLIIKDDQQDPELARRAVKELVDAGVVALIGPMTSDMGVAITPLLDQAKLVAVSPTVTTQQLSGKDDYFFRVSATTKEYATRSANYHAKNSEIRRLIVTYDLNNRSFCENWLENFTASFTRQGGEIIGALGFDTQGGQTFLALAGKLLNTQPDGILIIANSMDSALICQQIRKSDPGLYITLADWGATERLLELGGKAVEGVTVVQTFDRDNQAEAYQTFRKAYLDRYQREPGFPGVYTHDAAQVVLSALAARASEESLKEAILRLREFEGLQGRFRFDDFGDVQRSNASISIIRNNQFLVLE
jgi:branched-chain amino acid transport system substrate-binding protein